MDTTKTMKQSTTETISETKVDSQNVINLTALVKELISKVLDLKTARIVIKVMK